MLVVTNVVCKFRVFSYDRLHSGMSWIVTFRYKNLPGGEKDGGRLAYAAATAS